MHFEDLSDYSYEHGGDLFYDRTTPYEYCLVVPATYQRLNVGWLEAGRPHPTGAVPQDVVDKLAAITTIQQVNACLGKHECDLCDEPRSHPPLGSAEIRIPGRPGVVYAAPTLINHYITVHGYQPPAEFITAVQNANVEEWATKRWSVDGYQLAIAFPCLPDGASVLDPDDRNTWPDWLS